MIANCVGLSGIHSGTFSGLTEEMKTKVTQQIRDVVESKVFPSLKDMRNFLQNTYLPETRTDFGVSCLPLGEEFYRESLK